MAMTGFLGMRGTGDWADADFRPKSWREGLLRIMPNGDMPITAINSMGRSKKVTDPEFYWFSKDLAAGGATMTNMYHDALMTLPWLVGEAVVVGADLYAKMAEDDTKHFRAGHTVLAVDEANSSNYVFGQVINMNRNGADSYVYFKARVAAVAGVAFNADYLDVIGSAQAEGSPAPDAISYDADKFYGKTQIIETALDITRTQKRTKMRHADAYQEAKKDALLQHGRAWENTVINSVMAEGVGDNGKPQRFSWGMIPFLAAHHPANMLDFASGTALTWVTAGEDWLDESLELLFRYGRDTKMAVCGSGALLGIMKLVKASSNFQITTETGAYGVKVVRWVTPFGDILLKRHPLFTYKAYRRNSMLLFEPENLEFNYIDDTYFKPDNSEREGGTNKRDGTKESFITEGGWAIHFPKTMMHLTTVGVDGTL